MSFFFFFLLCSDQRTYRGPEFSFKTQTKINYECYTIYCTLSFKRESLPWVCLDAVLEMKKSGFSIGKGSRVDGGFWERLHGAFAIGSFVYKVVLLLLYFSAGQSGTRWPPGKNKTEPRGGVVSPRGRSSSFVVSNGGVGALRF